MPINYVTYNLWSRTQTQWQWSGGMVPVLAGLNYLAMFAIAEQLDIDVSPGMLLKIQALEAYTIEKIRKKMERK
ncbi:MULTISPECIES: DUF1799 domain-containing protein [Pectinatus]|uniref:DUF1799 domain-containing protein n=1 Tax=Pectinatus TaxID=864 RepID=UPI0018C58D84